MKPHRCFLATVSIVGLLVSCHRDEGDPTAFRAALKCGQTQAEIALLAQRHHAPSIGCPPPPSVPPSRCYVEFGRTGFDLVFDAQGLLEVTSSTRYGLKGLQVGAAEDLCDLPPRNRPGQS